MNATFGVLPTKWGNFRYWYMDNGESVIVTGYTSLGGQPYSIRLRLYRSKDGWVRHTVDDLRMKKVSGTNDGKPARPVAREVVLDYLPEQVNAVIGDS